MLIENINELKLDIDDVIYMFMRGLISYEEYTNWLITSVENDDPKVVEYMVDYGINQKNNKVDEYRDYHYDIDKLDKVVAKTICILNEKYPFIEFKNLKFLDDNFALPFDITYFFYNMDRKTIDDDEGNTLIYTTGDKVKDMKKLIEHYQNIVSLNENEELK